jgi:hypothetical protein
MERTKAGVFVSACMMAMTAKGQPAEEGVTVTTDDSIQSKVLTFAQTERRWKVEDTRVQKLDRPAMQGCSFFIASHKRQPIAPAPSYAVLPNGQIVSHVDPQAASRILAACASQADAGAWAEVLARFHPQVAPGVVVHDAKAAELAIEKAASAGVRFHPPAFVEGAHTTVAFYLMSYSGWHLHFIKATRGTDGTIDVEKKLIF